MGLCIADGAWLLGLRISEESMTFFDISLWRCGLYGLRFNDVGVTSVSILDMGVWPSFNHSSCNLGRASMSVSVSGFIFDFLSTVRRRDDLMLGLCKECVSCVWFHIPLLALHSPHPVSGRLHPLGQCRTGNPLIKNVNQT